MKNHLVLALIILSRKRGDYFGQKAVFSYALVFANTEIGIVNYTDFHQNDLRITSGAGISFLGRVSIMYHYAHPVLRNIFGDISRHSISFVIF